MSPRLLDLFCGAGGAAMGYHRAGFEVVGVDIEPQPDYPFEFHRADAVEFPLEGFDAIHASPPCQAHTAMRTMPNARRHEDLVAATRALLRSYDRPYVIENVEGAPLVNPVRLCGAALGLRTDTHDLARHRLFECSFPLMVPPCAHGARPVIGFYGDHVRDRRRISGSSDRGRDIGVKLEDKRQLAREAMGIDWMSGWRSISQAIPPAYTEHIGHYLLAEIKAARSSGGGSMAEAQARRADAKSSSSSEEE